MSHPSRKSEPLEGINSHRLRAPLRSNHPSHLPPTSPSLRRRSASTPRSRRARSLFLQRTMCSLAPPTALGLGFDAAAGARTATCGVIARGEPVRRVAAVVSSSAAPTKKRSRDGKIRDMECFAAAAGEVSAQQGQRRRLQERMSAELDAIRVLHRKAVLLCRGAGKSGVAGPAAKGEPKFMAAGLRRKEPLEAAAAKGKKTSPLDSAKQPAANRKEAVKQQQPSVQRAAAPSVREVQKRRRLEEIAVAREKCRQEVLEIERTRLPDETVYPWDLEELGIAFQYAFTRTWKQAHGPAV
ncbi:hypothetical protein HU200_024590 [Digitaria exilis]|uniref:Uncharacterized protein n=1 Tax=Digitaria exilis TaxID=1010633 RepID=A0A835C7F6_9POAL|nr:hypothetical protein HU200_024590 [Digitaria exilis]